MNTKLIAYVLAKLSHVFPDQVHAVVDTKSAHGDFYFNFFGMKILKGQLR